VIKPIELLPCLLVVLMAGATAVQAQPVQCEVDGKSVSPDNGATTAGVTGLMRCRNREGQLTREQELQNGRFMGRQYQDGKLRRERGVNERGNSHGTEKTFGPGGNLLSQAQYDNGSQVGVARRFHESGPPSRVTFYELVNGSSREVAVLEYNVDGSLREIRCGKRSVMPEDRSVCGFAGRQKSTLYAVYDGRASKTADLYRADLLSVGDIASRRGQLHVEMRYENGPGSTRTYRVYDTDKHPDNKNTLREERIYEAASDPDSDRLQNTRAPLLSLKKWDARQQLIQHTRYTGGQMSQDEHWWLNGQIKSRQVREGQGAAALIRSEWFDDNGKLTERFLETQRGERTGVQQEFYANGRLAVEEVWSAPAAAEGSSRTWRGSTRVVSRKQWDEKGQLIADDEILEDGSRRKR
jgi:antitoxin component YwqK of YwqJK toxin-antitoxin module